VGYLLTFIVFIQLNSVDFCNEWIYSKKHTSPLVTITQLVFWIGEYYFGFGLLILFCKKEGRDAQGGQGEGSNASERQEKMTFCQVLKGLL